MSFSCGHHGWRHALNPCPICHPEVRPAQNIVPDLKAEDILAPLDPFADMSVEEQLMWATPYYDELQRKKELHAQNIKEETINGKG